MGGYGKNLTHLRPVLRSRLLYARRHTSLKHLSGTP
jgi:hypothetical protein